MPPLSDSIRVYEPATLTDLLSLYSDRPNATIFAGGTHLMGGHYGTRIPRIGGEIISLRRIEELKRVTRSERHLEIGAAAPISSVIDIGANVAPPVLLRALRSIGYKPVRNQATVGGNICVPERRLTTFPVLMLLDAQVELRRSGKSRWISISRFANLDGTLNFNPGEICTRVRIPLGEWNMQVFRPAAAVRLNKPWNVSFAGVAETRKGVLSDLRFIFGGMGKTIIRSREIEAELASRKLPMNDRDRDQAMEVLSLAIDSTTPPVSETQRRVSLRYLDWFISQINID